MEKEINEQNFQVGNVTVSPQHNTLCIREKSCRLQPKVMAVLHYLKENKERVISNEELLEEVWPGRVVTHSSIQKSINSLRTAFTSIDDTHEYVVYFSKRGYQLIYPKASLISRLNDKNIAFIVSSIALILFTTIYFIFSGISFDTPKNILTHKTDSLSNQKNSHVLDNSLPLFTQVMPYISNTGNEQLIEPHTNSNRVAFIRHEPTVNSTDAPANESNLYIRSTQGERWKVSTARGKFIALSWSESGRNIVTIDAHKEQNKNSSEPITYYTFHIFTLDFKGEKVIEKNVLSHWQGNVSSVNWWDENTLTFTAAHTKNDNYQLYRYGVAEQNLTMLPATILKGKLLMAETTNKETALVSSMAKGGEYLSFLNQQQRIVSQWPLPFNVRSLNWLPKQNGVLLLSHTNELFVLYTDGRLFPVNYFPKVQGFINRATIINTLQNKQMVLTVSPFLSQTGLTKHTAVNEASLLPENQLLKKGGGFIYSTSKVIQR